MPHKKFPGVNVQNDHIPVDKRKKRILTEVSEGASPFQHNVKLDCTSKNLTIHGLLEEFDLMLCSASSIYLDSKGEKSEMDERDLYSKPSQEENYQ